MGNKTKEVQPTSQATPFAEDLLKLLQGQLEGGEFGLGAGPLQREAGTALRQFIEMGGGQFNLSPLFKQLQEVQNRRIGEQTADVREAFGVAGSRFGTPLAVGESRLRRELETVFGAQLGELSRQEFTNQQQRLLAAISGLQSFGQQNIAPFLQLAQQGIFGTQFTTEQNPFISFINAIGGAAGGVGSILEATGGAGGGTPSFGQQNQPGAPGEPVPFGTGGFA